jgi:hypothetical protein
VRTDNGVAPVVVSSAQVKATSSQRVAYLIYFIFGALEILLVFRLVLKLMGASTASVFVRSIYGLSSIFIWPFEGIFRRAVSQGIETASVLEPSTIVALIVYAVAAWGLVRLLEVLTGEQQDA